MYIEAYLVSSMKFYGSMLSNVFCVEKFGDSRVWRTKRIHI